MWKILRNRQVILVKIASCSFVVDHPLANAGPLEHGPNLLELQK
jgi:hypothetical protein